MELTKFLMSKIVQIDLFRTIYLPIFVNKVIAELKMICSTVLRAELLTKSLSERTKSSWSLQTLARFILIATDI